MDKTHFSHYRQRFTAILFGSIFLSIVGLVSLTFFDINPKVHVATRIYNTPIDSVWLVLMNRTIYKNTKPEITELKIYDTAKPNWVEYYGKMDSISCITKFIIKDSVWNYVIINRKYEQVNGITIILSATNKGTKVTIYEKSIYQNVWARVYFSLLKPNIVLDYEFLKIQNSLTSLHQ